MAEKTSHAATALKGPGELLNESITFFKKKYRELLLVMLIPTIFSFLLSMSESSGSLAHAASRPSFLLIFLDILVTILAAIALLYTLPDSTQPLDAYKKALNKFFPYLGVSLLALLAFIGGSILLIVPGIIFGMWFIFSGYVLIFENKGVLASLSQSKEYVSGRWFAVFGRAAVLFCVVIGISLVGVFVSALFAIVHIPILPLLINAVVSLFVRPFSAVYFYLLYKDIK